jgi:hypothetical protein
MPSKRPLRAVQPGDSPTQRRVPATITEAVESGTSRDVMAAMRKALAAKLDDGDVSSNAIASAYKELRELDGLIRRLDAEAEAEEAKQHGDEVSRRRSFNAAAI